MGKTSYSSFNCIIWVSSLPSFHDFFYFKISWMVNVIPSGIQIHIKKNSFPPSALRFLLFCSKIITLKQNFKVFFQHNLALFHDSFTAPCTQASGPSLRNSQNIMNTGFSILFLRYTKGWINQPFLSWNIQYKKTENNIK